MLRQALFVAAAALWSLACSQAPVQAQAREPILYASSGDESFDAWRADFSARALGRGRDRAAVESVLSGLRPDPAIVELDQRQPEFVSPVWDYVANRVTAQRIEGGRRLKASLGDTLPAVAQRYGVDPDIILGIWGLESNYGAAALNYNAAGAIATLAHEGRRRAQFETYLLAVIEMVERGLAGPEQLRSSWAGALGQPQFMPDVFLSTAVDWNQDGQRDIWNDQADVAASIAHYLSDRGWRAGEPVFDEVRLPPSFDYALADGTSRPLSGWRERGVERIGGGFAASSDLQAQLFLPAGAQGPALLLYPNFGVIRRYNASDRYALVVALLARAFRDEGGLETPWPRHLGALGRDQMLELQTLLNGLGFDAGAADGLFGSSTRRAVRAFQAQAGQAADGFPTLALLQALRARAGVSVEPAPTRAPIPLQTRGIRDLQRILNQLGYPAGRADGRIGPQTRAAIRAFERARGMEVRGRATDLVLEAARAARG